MELEYEIREEYLRDDKEDQEITVTGLVKLLGLRVNSTSHILLGVLCEKGNLNQTVLDVKLVSLTRYAEVRSFTLNKSFTFAGIAELPYLGRVVYVFIKSYLNGTPEQPAETQGGR